MPPLAYQQAIFAICGAFLAAICGCLWYFCRSSDAPAKEKGKGEDEASERDAMRQPLPSMGLADMAHPSGGLTFTLTLYP